MIDNPWASPAKLVQKVKEAAAKEEITLEKLVQSPGSLNTL